ncbi:1-acyl-sn-glycerol-3-phosphate acyltransferase [Halomonas sediminis]
MAALLSALKPSRYWLLRGLRQLLRLLILLIMRLCYRLRVHGLEHVPREGAALIVCNHVSFMDALILGGACPRSLRFVMERTIFESPWLNWWFRLVGAIPIESERRNPGSLRKTLEAISRALRNGEVVMVFPEGKLTTDGEVHTFRRGLDAILARDPVAVIPAGITGLWGSWTSHHEGPALKKWPRRWRARVSLRFGSPVTPQALVSQGRARQNALRHYLEARVRVLTALADDEQISS